MNSTTSAFRSALGPSARQRIWRIFGPAILAVMPCIGVVAQDKRSDDLARRITPLISDYQGDVAVGIKNLSGDGEFWYRRDQPMATASLIKLPLLVATYQQIDSATVDPAQLIELTHEDQVPGSGILTRHFSPGLKLPLIDAIRLMMRYSDNTATNLVIDQVGLPTTTESMKSLGLLHTQLHAKVYRRDTSIAPKRSQRYGLGSTSAADMIALLEGIHTHQVASKTSCEAMIAHLLSCDDQVKLPAGLPSGTKIAHKTGGVSSVRTDAGIIYGPGKDQAFAICVLTENNKDRGWSAESEPHQLIADIGRAAYQVFYGNDASADSPESTRLKLGAHGDLVESLQRTLNARMSPSPGLSIDGDFGPMTEAAVMRFQESKQLPSTGIVDEQTFAALGTLIDQDEAVPDPATLNSQWPEKEPADPVQGVPFVTAKAWAIVDADSGALIAGQHENDPRPMASTTKLMTAMVISELAKHDPDIWSQTVTFSKRADDTVGSSARLRVGESLSVEQLMYGLLLPSGNDASVAFAEHFGAQHELLATAFPEGTWTATAAYDRFIEAMNLLAERHDLQHTTFVNPHGLTEPGHQASARDLAKLAVAAGSREKITRVVATPQFGCTVTGPGGYQRNVAWYNTNRLLRIDGYEGVKTGTTGAAGACLIAKGTREGQSRIVVVLGSASSDARYSDTRNLFRWGWNRYPAGQTDADRP